MPIFQYQTQISENGSISLPALPEYRNRKVVVHVLDVGEDFSQAISKQLDGISDAISEIETPPECEHDSDDLYGEIEDVKEQLENMDERISELDEKLDQLEELDDKLTQLLERFEQEDE